MTTKEGVTVSAFPEQAGNIDESPFVVPAHAFTDAFGEDLDRVLDLETWREGPDLAGLYENLEKEVVEAVERETRVSRTIREEFLPHLRDQMEGDVPELCGLHSFTPADMKRVHDGVLFSGRVEACDGTVQVHDTTALTIYQIGVTLVSYNGERGALGTRLFRRDLRQRPADPMEEVNELLVERAKRRAVGGESGEDLSELARRGLMSYAERSLLTDRSSAEWRMGHGSPAPYELLTGAGRLNLAIPAAEVIEKLICEHGKFVFVPSEPRDRAILTLGSALRPLEFVVLRYYTHKIRRMVDQGNLRSPHRERADLLVDNIGPRVSIVVYRASAASPPRLAYVPAEPTLCAQGVAIAMADSLLQPHRGFPLLIDIADRMCAANFGGAEFFGAVRTAYTAVGHPYDYLSERETRS